MFRYFMGFRCSLLPLFIVLEITLEYSNIVTFQPFQTKWAVSAVRGVPLHYQFTYTRCPLFCFHACLLMPCTMYIYTCTKAYFRNVSHLLSCPFTISLLYTKCPPLCSHACQWLACLTYTIARTVLTTYKCAYIPHSTFSIYILIMHTNIHTAV